MEFQSFGEDDSVPCKFVDAVDSISSEISEQSKNLLDSFQLDVQSESIDRRKMAARLVTDVAMTLDQDDDGQVQEFFTCVEQLMADSELSPNTSLDSYQASPQQCIFDQLRPLFRFFREQHFASAASHFPLAHSVDSARLSLFEQANSRLPVLLARCLLDPSCHHALCMPNPSCQFVHSSIQTIWALLDEELFNQEISQCFIVPVLFEFLRLSSDQFTLFVSKGNNPDERWLRARVEVLSILTSLLCRIYRFKFKTVWLTGELIPRYMAFHTEPSPMIQKRREFREVLAHSLTQIAQFEEGLIKPAFVDADLFPIFQRYMRDTTEVQNAVLQHLADFCRMLSDEYRECLIKEISHQVTIDSRDSRTWRQRVQLAEQLTQLINLFPISLINRYLSAFALSFCDDKISEVRNQGVTMLAAVLTAFIQREWEDCRAKVEIPSSSSPCSTSNSEPKTSDDDSTASNESTDTVPHPPHLPLTDKLLAEIRTSFWRSRNWQRRQSFGRLLYTLVQRKSILDAQFYYLFFHDLINISDDDVANVRQYFCLLAQLNQFDKSLGQTVRKRLKGMAAEDSDLEIRNLAKIALGQLNPDEEGIDLNTRTCRSY